MVQRAVCGGSDFVGPIADLAVLELVRADGSPDELRDAMAFVTGGQARDTRAYEALSPRMRRLVDLVGVTDPDVSRHLCRDADPMVNALDGGGAPGR